MRKILFTLIFCLLFTIKGYCALATTTVWEVRTTGAATNGGGYVPGSSGTDFSQQNAAQYALTTATTAVANAIILDASAAADMVGNIAYVVSGTNFIVGYYEIISVVAGVSITVDRNCTTAAGALGVINIGGAVDHPQRLTGITNTTDTMWIKKGVYQYLSGSYILNNSGGYIKKIIGYNATRGDDPTTVANMPQFDGKNTLDYGIVSASASGFLIMNCAVYNNNTAGINCENSSIINCIVYNNASGIVATYSSIINCIAYSNVVNGIFSDHGAIVNCVSHNNAVGIYSYYSSVINCIAYNNATTGIFSDLGSIINCIVYNNATYGISGTILYFDYNCYYGNGTNLSGITAGAHDVNADPLFVDAAGNDFTLQSTSPCISAGLSTLAGLTSNFKINIGVDQSDHTTGGGGGEHSFGSVN